MNELKQTVVAKTDSELLSMVYDIDEWSPEMLSLVEEELRQRNILPTDLQERKQKTIEEEDLTLTAGKEASIGGVVLGWITSFGFLGIYIGYNYANSKTRSKYTGKSYYTYNEKAREQGKWLLFASSVFTALGLLYKFS